ncbi:unnamed protein product [Caenorhabditis brenneri]
MIAKNMLRLLLSLLALFSIVSTIEEKWDHFQFDITLFCNEAFRKEYNLAIEWWEDDTLPGKEQITRTKIFRAPTGNFSFTMEGAMDGDEPKSDGYKAVAYITHDCERWAEQRDLTFTVEPLCPIGGSCYYRIYEDITSRQGDHYIHAKGLKMNDLTPFPDFKPTFQNKK